MYAGWIDWHRILLLSGLRSRETKTGPIEIQPIRLAEIRVSNNPHKSLSLMTGTSTSS
jgi:hypothetical protein